MSEIFLYQRDSAQTFVDSFIKGLQVYQGIITIVQQSEELLAATEIGFHLEKARAYFRIPTTGGKECEALEDMLAATELPAASREAYAQAISHLQRIFDAKRATPGHKLPVQVIFEWPAVISPEYIRLLRDSQPEALLIFAYYAVVLHQASHSWLVGNVGQFLIETLSKELGPKWQKFLKFPHAILSETTATVSPG